MPFRPTTTWRWRPSRRRRRRCRSTGVEAGGSGDAGQTGRQSPLKLYTMNLTLAVSMPEAGGECRCRLRRRCMTSTGAVGEQHRDDEHHQRRSRAEIGHGAHMAGARNFRRQSRAADGLAAGEHVGDAPAIFMEARSDDEGRILVAVVTPLDRPKSRPERDARRMPTISGIPPQTTAPRRRTPDMAMMEPTDESMPPRMMTVVMPQARQQVKGYSGAAHSRLPWVGKLVLGQS